MKKLFLNHWKELIIIVSYVVVGCLAYCVWFNSLWHKWYINLITAVVIIIIGAVIGFFYIQSVDRDREHNNALKAKEEESNLSNTVEGSTEENIEKEEI